MGKIKYYVSAMRLRTLPLSLAGVALGLMLATADFYVKISVVVFTVLTTLSLQILSNISNELGDNINGTDTEDREGPHGALVQGALTQRDFKLMIKVNVGFCLLFGALLIYSSFGTLFSLDSCVMMLLGVSAIKAAMSYTLGKNPYGYRGWGDVYVFVFFGIVSVMGSYYIAAHTVNSWHLFLPAISIGAFSVAVLNVNNIRDMVTDAATRTTLPLIMGEKKAKLYQISLIFLGWVAMFIYTYLRIYDICHYLFVLTLPLFVWHLLIVMRKSGRELDMALPVLSISTLIFAVLSGIGYLIILFQ